MIGWKNVDDGNQPAATATDRRASEIKRGRKQQKKASGPLCVRRWLCVCVSVCAYVRLRHASTKDEAGENAVKCAEAESRQTTIRDNGTDGRPVGRLVRCCGCASRDMEMEWKRGVCRRLSLRTSSNRLPLETADPVALDPSWLVLGGTRQSGITEARSPTLHGVCGGVR